MTSITVFQDHEAIQGFRCIGHSGYADKGQDIVCAAVSVLVINAINSIEAFTSATYQLDTDEESALIDFRFKEQADEAQLLLRSMLLGLQGIQETYGNDNLKLEFKEV